jgi:hypothetical protein
MTELSSKAADAALILTPVDVAERGSPTWLRVHVTLRDGQLPKDEVVALTTGDNT